MSAGATITADSSCTGMRLDVFVSAHLAPEYSRSQVARMIKAGLVTVNGLAARASSGVRPGDRIEITPPSPPSALPSFAEAPAIAVLAEDPEFIVVNKAA